MRPYDKHIHTARNLVERFFQKIKNCRRIITRSAERDGLLTMKPTRGYNSPGCHSTLATTRRFLFHDPAR
jgi:transposase